MKLINRDNLIDACSLQAPPELDIEELLKPVSILRVSVDEFFEKGIEKLGVALVEPFLKLTNSSRNWTIYQKGRYAIAQESGDQVLVTPWKLENEASVQTLKQALTEDKFLVSIQEGGYVVMARKSDLAHLAVEPDFGELWLQVSRAYLEVHILSLVNWSYQSRRPCRLDALIKDVALRFSQSGDHVQEAVLSEECFSASSYFMDTMPEIIAPVLREVTDFIQNDLWAYYSVETSRRGISVTRHRDARALIWNKQLIDSASQDELEREAFSAWAVD